MIDCDCLKGHKYTFATVPQQTRMLGSQLSFATIHKTKKQVSHMNYTLNLVIKLVSH